VKPPPFRERPIRFLEVRRRDGWQVKLYGIGERTAPADPSAFEAGLDLAWSELPEPDESIGRPGVGFAVLHRAREAAYLVFAWWDRENELPTRVFIDVDAEAGAWRPARGGESFCVWDLRVIWFEREAFAETVLGGDGGVGAYLERRLHLEPGHGGVGAPQADAGAEFRARVGPGR
jgi:hypothetical protein